MMQLNGSYRLAGGRNGSGYDALPDGGREVMELGMEADGGRSGEPGCKRTSMQTDGSS